MVGAARERVGGNAVARGCECCDFGALPGLKPLKYRAEMPELQLSCDPLRTRHTHFWGRARNGNFHLHMAIFLTGSTGYLGGYLVAGLWSGHTDRLNVLVRAKTTR